MHPSSPCPLPTNPLLTQTRANLRPTSNPTSRPTGMPRRDQPVASGSGAGEHEPGPSDSDAPGFHAKRTQSTAARPVASGSGTGSGTGIGGRKPPSRGTVAVATPVAAVATSTGTRAGAQAGAGSGSGNRNLVAVGTSTTIINSRTTFRTPGVNPASVSSSSSQTNQNEHRQQTAIPASRARANARTTPTPQEQAQAQGGGGGGGGAGRGRGAGGGTTRQQQVAIPEESPSERGSGYSALAGVLVAETTQITLQGTGGAGRGNTSGSGNGNGGSTSMSRTMDDSEDSLEVNTTSDLRGLDEQVGHYRSGGAATSTAGGVGGSGARSQGQASHSQAPSTPRHRKRNSGRDREGDRAFVPNMGDMDDEDRRGGTEAGIAGHLPQRSTRGVGVERFVPGIFGRTRRVLTRGGEGGNGAGVEGDDEESEETISEGGGGAGNNANYGYEQEEQYVRERQDSVAPLPRGFRVRRQQRRAQSVESEGGSQGGNRSRSQSVQPEYNNYGQHSQGDGRNPYGGDGEGSVLDGSGFWNVSNTLNIVLRAIRFLIILMYDLLLSLYDNFIDQPIRTIAYYASQLVNKLNLKHLALIVAGVAVLIYAMQGVLLEYRRGGLDGLGTIAGPESGSGHLGVEGREGVRVIRHLGAKLDGLEKDLARQTGLTEKEFKKLSKAEQQRLEEERRHRAEYIAELRSMRSELSAIGRRMDGQDSWRDGMDDTVKNMESAYRRDIRGVQDSVTRQGASFDDKLEKIADRINKLEARTMSDEEFKDMLYRILPEHVPVITTRDGNVEIGPRFWTEVRRVIKPLTQDDLAPGSQLSVKAEMPSWNDFLAGNEDRLRSWAEKTFDTWIVNDGTVPKTFFMSMLEEETEKLREKLVDAHEERFAEIEKRFGQATANAERNRHLPPVLDIDSEKIIVSIQEIVDQAMMKHTQKIVAKPDYALASSGARIVAAQTSKSYDLVAGGWVTSLLRWGQARAREPRVALSPRVEPGMCWSFKGQEGTLGMTLADPVKVTEITVEHVQRQLVTPDMLNSAPKEIEVWGYVERHQREKANGYLDLNPNYHDGRIAPRSDTFLLTTFEYDPHANFTVQSFSLPHDVQALKLETNNVIFKFRSNWGKPYTCIYRVRVHGEKEPVRSIFGTIF